MLDENDSPVEVTIFDKTIHVNPGTRIVDVLPSRTDDQGRPYLGAVANNRLVSLDAPLWTQTEIQPVTVADPHGASIYRRCATYLMFAALAEVYPNLRLEIGQSMGTDPV